MSNKVKNFHKLPYPKGYKSLRLFVRYIKDFQLKRYKLINELSGKNPLNPGFELCNDTLRTMYSLILQSIVRSKPTLLIGKICQTK